MAPEVAWDPQCLQCVYTACQAGIQLGSKVLLVLFSCGSALSRTKLGAPPPPSGHQMIFSCPVSVAVWSHMGLGSQASLAPRQREMTANFLFPGEAGQRLGLGPPAPFSEVSPAWSYPRVS